MTFQRKYDFLDTIARENPLYKIWAQIKGRCYVKSVDRYMNYGGRGITMCDEWHYDFKSFYNWAMNSGYQEGLSIERIDVNGNYEPSNCTWITVNKQARNRTTTHWLNYKGEQKSLAEVAEIEDVNYDSLFQALKRYENLDKAIQVAKLNKQGMMATNTSGYRNIYPDGKKWYVKYKNKYYGTYDTIEQAIEARDKVIEEYKNRTS